MAEKLTDETRRFTAPGGAVASVEFFVDPDPSEPWDNDGAVPLVAAVLDMGRESLNTEPARGLDLLAPLEHLSDRILSAKRAEILAAINDHAADTRRAFLGHYAGNDSPMFPTVAEWDRCNAEEFPGLSKIEARREFLANYIPENSDNERGLRFIAELWKVAGVPAEVRISRGYSQGDQAALLIVAHPEAVKAWGFATRDGRPDFKAYLRQCPEDFKRAADCWGAWAWGGGVVGYRLETAEGEEIESCWGFYPERGQDAFNLEQSHPYALEQALGAGRAWVETQGKAHAAAYAAALLDSRPDLAPQWVEA